MINKDALADFSADLITADKIVERVKAGVPAGREMMADEVMPFIRAYVLMRETAAESAAFMAEQHAREMAGMAVADLTTER